MLILKRLLLVGIVWHLGGVLSVTHAATDCNVVTEISPAECISLLELYNSTDGPNWKNSLEWNETNTPCSWHGITCENHDVTEINLSDNQLTGTIPNFSALPNLEWLYLSSNQLTGRIPNFSTLSNLQGLHLWNNQLTGTIPNFSALPNLEVLSLSNNQLTGTIPNFSALPNLEMLDLRSNQLTGTLPNFSALPNLEMLALHSNQLTGTLPNFNALSNLETLDLGSNQLMGLIPNFSALPNLLGLELSENQLTGTIPNFSALPNLVGLALSENQLTGTIPNFSAMPNLEWLYLGSNQLTGMIPVSYNALINLNYLDIRNNLLCKKADYDYSIWPIEQSRLNDETTWQAQLETFPICETSTNNEETGDEIVTVYNFPLKFIRLKELYQIGEIVEVKIEVHFTAKNPADRVDLWIAVQLPSKEFLYMTPLPSADLFSTTSQFFKSNLGTTEDTFSVISDFKVEPGLGGNYTFYAALIETGKNPLNDGMWVMRYIEQASTMLSAR